MTMVVDRCVLSAGDWINDKYQVIKTLGEGSFGLVNLVKDRRNNKYALKLLRLWDVTSELREPLTGRFEMEYKTGQIDCDYLVRSLDYGKARGNPYIVMEYCPGGDLSSLVNSGEYDRIQRSCQHILYGLKALHINGKVHRDLKPENVLFKTNGVAALTDFGITGDRNKRMTQRNIFGQPQQIFGTYAYMAPEQANRARGQATVLPTTDIFSFGVLVYQLLTGILPFGPLTDHNELAQYQKNSFNGVWHSTPLKGVPDALAWCKLIEGCLVPNFKERFQSVDDVLKHLPGRNHAAVHNSVPSVPKLKNTGSKTILRVMQGDEYRKEYALDDMLRGGRRMLRIGREPDNDIVIKEKYYVYVSRYHCTLEKDNYQRWILRDGQWNHQERCWKPSSNGTFVWSEQVTSLGRILAAGDIVSIGDTKLRVECC